MKIICWSKKGRSLGSEILMVFLGCIMVYAILFVTGYILYGQWIQGIIAVIVAGIMILWLRKLWQKENQTDQSG